MNKLLKLFVLAMIVLLSSCKPKGQTVEQKVNKDTASSFDTIIVYNKEEVSNNTHTIEDFLEKLKQAIRNNDTNFINSSIAFPFESRSMGELVDSYNSYNELKTDKNFNAILKAIYKRKVDFGQNEQEFYSISYIGDEIEIYYYAIKKDNQFKLVRMETPD